jgi:hypothetical protein
MFCELTPSLVPPAHAVVYYIKTEIPLAARGGFPSAKGGPPMAQQPPHVIPSIYLANYLNDFEPLVPRYGVTPLGRKKRWKGSNIKKRP